MTPWNGTFTAAMKGDDEIHGRGFLCLAVCDQLFAVIIRLRLYLDAVNVSIRFGISESTYSCMFATWIVFYLRSYGFYFRFHQGSKFHNGCHHPSESIFLTPGLLLTVTKWNVRDHQV